MNSGHVIGYVGGLAVAAGVGAAVWLGTPTASADVSSPSAHSASASTAKSARAPQRTHTVGLRKPAPARKVTASSSVKAVVAAPTTPHDLNLTYDPVTDKTSVTVVDTTTNSPIGSTVTVDGSARAPVLSSDGKRALITTNDHNPVTDQNDTAAVVIDMIAGGQIGNTFGFAGASPESASFGPDGTCAVVTLLQTSTSRVFVAMLDTTAGTQTGIANLEVGYPFVAPMWNADGTRVLITLAQSGGTVTAVTVLDTTTGDVAGATSIEGFAEPAPIITPDGTRAVFTTTVYTSNNSGNWPSTRVTVVNTMDGRQAGAALDLPGASTVSLLNDGRTALIRNSSGFVSILDTANATFTPPLPLLPPWGLDALWRTPLGAALTPVVFVVGLVGSAFLAFYVLPAILVIPTWIAEAFRALGLPVAALI